MNRKKIVLLTSGLLIMANLFSQNLLQGVVQSAQNHKPLANVQIVVLSGKSEGTTTDEAGKFSLVTSQKKGTLLLKMVGFKGMKTGFHVTGNRLNLGILLLDPQTYALDEINIRSGMVKSRKTPVSITEINARTLSNELADQPLPLVFNNDPSVFAVRNGGGSGDASLSIRGFKQENVALLLNGIPINGEENGLVYWSNWLGLNDVAAEIQIQKGPGFANLASNAVGGSINIITKTAGRQKGGSVGFQTTDYGNRKVSFAVNSGATKSGWQWAATGSWFGGKGYVEATSVRGFSYFLAASKQIDKRNRINITLMGAPQHHDQRTLKLSWKEVERYGYRYNKDWGGLDGQVKNASANFYHKPFLILSHDLKISEKQRLSNSVYCSYGTGGGNWSESFQYAPSIFSYRTASGRVDWKKIVENNAYHEGSVILENGDTVSGYSINVGTYFLASHIETGWMSSYEQHLGKHLLWTTGVHYRYFNSFLREEISDLMGGRFFVEDYGWSLAGVAGREQIKTVGDIIKVNNHSIINSLNLYSRIVYENRVFNAFLSVKGSGSFYRRTDKYNYPVHPKSALSSRSGFDARAGMSYHPGKLHLLYINGAIVSKVPYFKFVFGNFTNVPVQNLHNENIKTIEAGYSLNTAFFGLNVTGYSTLWHNVSMLTNEYVQLENNQQSRTMINGLDALHKGIEWTAHWNISPVFHLGVLATLADYRWKNNVSARLINKDNVVTDTVNVFVKGLHVGGTAQQKMGVNATVRLAKTVKFKAEYLYYNKLYADFNPLNRNTPSQTDAYRFPSYGVVNLYVTVPFKMGNQQALFQLNGFNLFNKEYIETGEDGSTHQLDSFRGFWSYGRNVSLLLKFYF